MGFGGGMRLGYRTGGWIYGAIVQPPFTEHVTPSPGATQAQMYGNEQESRPCLQGGGQGHPAHSVAEQTEGPIG